MGGMSRVLLLVAALVCAGCRGYFNPVADQTDGGTDGTPAGPPIRYIQSAYAGNSNGVIGATFSVDQSAGDTIVAVVYYADATIASVTDARGNVYRSAIGPLVSGALLASIFYATGIVAAAPGSNTVIVQFSNAPSKGSAGVIEYANIDPMNPIDQTSGKVGGGTEPPSSGTLVTTSYGDLLVAAVATEGSLGASVPGYAMRLQASDFVMLDLQTATRGDFAAIADAATGSNWVTELVALRRQ
jgi:hypothetical protein